MASHEMSGGQAIGMMGMPVAGSGGEGVMMGMMPAGMVPPPSGPAGMMMMPPASAVLPLPVSSSIMPGQYTQEQQQQPFGNGHFQFNQDHNMGQQEQQQQQLSSSGGGEFQISDDLAAQLAAHLSNQDALLSLAKSIAEYMPQVQHCSHSSSLHFMSMM
jgi:hypothetical protein